MTWFTEADLRRLAGERSYARGQRYVTAVADLRQVPGGMAATVQGTEEYQVRLGRGGTGLVGWCDCPYGADGAFCKHCVAVGLVLLADSGADEAGPSKEDADPVRAWLGSLDRDELVELVSTQAGEDEAFHRRLSIRAASAGGQVDTIGLRRELSAALRSRGFVPYSGAFDYAQRAAEALDGLEDLLHAGQAATVVPLARRAVELIAKAMQQMDDSSGVTGDACQRAMVLYADACRIAPPDGPKLARWLVDLQVDGPGWPQVDLGAFSPALGAEGLAAYQDLVAQRWRKVCGAEPDAYGRLTVQHLREQLARLSGDVDELVGVLADDLSSGWQYLRIADEFTGAGRQAEALEWAERGRAAYPDRPDPRLLDFLVAGYERVGRVEDAIEVRRSAFVAFPDVATWTALRKASESAGGWPGERRDALAYLVEAASRDQGDALVRVLLYEDDVAAAWHAAGQHGCRPTAWMAVAERRAATHPADAIPHYQRAVAEAVEGRTKEAYARAADHLVSLRDLHSRAGTLDEFAMYLDRTVAAHRAKRNFVAELARRGLISGR